MVQGKYALEDAYGSSFYVEIDKSKAVGWKSDRY
jgi:hypothetical protein